jgi:hypothetical protein
VRSVYVLLGLGLSEADYAVTRAHAARVRPNTKQLKGRRELIPRSTLIGISFEASQLESIRGHFPRSPK